MYRNAVNSNYMQEVNAVSGNVAAVESGGTLDFPILMFVSDGTEVGEYWIPCQENFAAWNDAQLIQLESGHYIHYSEHEYIAEEALKYISALQ